MVYSPPIAVYDACVLYPFHLRNLLIQCAVDRLVDARGTDAIHDEWIRSLATGSSAVSLERLQRTRDLMNTVLPDATVSGYEAYLDKVSLHDPDDRHVVAAAIAAGASLIITWNVRDFPPGELAEHKLRCQTPDTLLMNLYADLPDLAIESTQRARTNLTRTRPSAASFVEALQSQGLERFSSVMKKHLGQI